jgi:hypothetical protein
MDLDFTIFGRSPMQLYWLVDVRRYQIQLTHNGSNIDNLATYRFTLTIGSLIS